MIVAGEATFDLALSNVGVSLGRGRDVRAVLGCLSLAFSPGEFTIIIGPNGAGKTTLLRAMAGLVPAAGHIKVKGRSLAGLSRNERGRTIAYLPQGGRIHWPLAVRDVVALGRLPFGKTGRTLTDADQFIVAQAITACRIDDLAGRPATALSGGEKARVLLARSLAVQAPILLTDEPAASLDPAHQVAIMTTLQQEAFKGRIVIAVLHDLSLAARYATRIVALHGGNVAADGTPDDVFASSTLDSIFGIRLLRAWVEGKLLLAPAQPAHGPIAAIE